MRPTAQVEMQGMRSPAQDGRVKARVGGRTILAEKPLPCKVGVGFNTTLFIGKIMCSTTLGHLEEGWQ